MTNHQLTISQRHAAPIFDMNDNINNIDTSELFQHAFPYSFNKGTLTISNYGLTKREYFAALALQGVVSGIVMQPENAASVAVDYADALLAKLGEAPQDFTEARTTAPGTMGNAIEEFVHYIAISSACGSELMARKLAPGLLSAVAVLLSRKPELLHELVSVAAEMKQKNN